MEIAAVLGLALLDTLSPTVIGVTLYLLLAGPHRLGALLGAYLTTVAVAYFALGVVLMLGLGAVVPAVDDAVLAWVQAAVGVALIVGSYFIPDRKAGADPAPTLRAMVLLGLGTWLFEFATAVPYFAAIGVMTAAELPAGHWLPLLAAYVTIMVLPGILLLTAWATLRDRVQDRFEHWRKRLSSGSRSTLRWIVGIAGALILLDAAPDQITITF